MEKIGRYPRYYILSAIYFVLTIPFFFVVILSQPVYKNDISILAVIFFLFSFPPILMLIFPKLLGSLLNRIYHLVMLCYALIALFNVRGYGRDSMSVLLIVIEFIVYIYLLIYFLELRGNYFLANYKKMQILGEKSLKENRLSKGRRYLTKSISFNNENADSYKLRGLVFTKTNRFIKAFNDFEHALELYEMENDEESVKEVKAFLEKLPEKSCGILI